MKPLSLWLALLIAVEAAAQVPPRPPNRGDPCKSLTLPWTVPRAPFEDLPDSVFETLMRCPERLHGCSDELISCRRATYTATCSCAPNCKAYRDCCWNVPLSTLDAELPASGCVEIYLDFSWKTFVNMVVGCPQSWPQDDIRKFCEQPQYSNETFYFIPVTSINQVTYRNAFCALCNDDFNNATYWNATQYKEGVHSALVTLPDFVENNPTLHLRPCSLVSPTDTCRHPVPKLISRRCKTYYAPVEEKESPGSPVYRNVFCAMCSDANLTALSCSPTLHLNKVSSASRKKTMNRIVPAIFGTPNLAALFKPVVSTPECYAEHDGHCYIRNSPTLYTEEPRSGKGLTRGEPSALPPVETPKNRNYYTAHNYVTVISLSMSICCLVLKVAVFCLYRNVRSFSAKCTLCLSVTILLTHLLFLIANCFQLPPYICLIAALLLHYGFLSTFFWTSVLSHDIWRGVTAVKLSSTRHKTLLSYGALAWGLPLAIVSTALTVYLTAPGSVWSPGYGRAGCWIGNIYGLITYFLVPMVTLLLFCLCLYLRTVCYIRTTTLSAGYLRQSAEDAERLQRKERISQMSLFVRLALIMGAAWAIAFVGIFVPIAEFDYVTNALVGCQGVYLFLAFKDYRYLCSCGNKRANMTTLNGSDGTSRSDLTSTNKQVGQILLEEQGQTVVLHKAKRDCSLT